MSLTITEAWIRERVQLNHDNLEDVRSLSLPGTYQEKVANLGNALSSFARLKQLDLSRNSLQSLHGLQHLRLLEKLNLYYNNISSLQELNRLRHNASLQELDLRLNPVTKNEPDYRLYLVHMLPNLRKLDDRSIRESERKSALLHFDSDQATGLTEHSASPARDGGRSELPRSKHVRSLGARAAVEDDDSDLLDLLARTDGDLSKPRPITGSGVGTPSVDIQPTQDYQRTYSQRTPPRRRPDLSGSSQYAGRELNLGQTEPSQHIPDSERSQGRPWSQGQLRSKVTLAEQEEEEEDREPRGRVDSNLKFTDENDAYSAYSSKVNFTPNPKSGERADSMSSYDMHPRDLGDTYEEPPPVQRLTKQIAAPSTPGLVQSSFLDNILNLVDRYWNGSKSLHSHSKFQAQAQSLLDKLLTEASGSSQEQLDRLQLEVARYAQENVSLRTKLGASAGGGRGQGQAGPAGNVQRAMEKAQADVDSLHDELQRVREANWQLKSQLENAQRKAPEMPPSSSHVDTRESSKASEKLQQENDRLKVQLKHFTQLQELASMLQESHKSLVTTNDHLLTELEETKQRHLEEVKQLHWSYNQLKQTMDVLPPTAHTPRQHPLPPPHTPTRVNGYERGDTSPTAGYSSYSPGKKVKGFSYSNGAL